MEGPPLGPGGEDITWPDQVAPRGRKASSTRKIKPQTSNLLLFLCWCVYSLYLATPKSNRGYVCCFPLPLWSLCVLLQHALKHYSPTCGHFAVVLERAQACFLDFSRCSCCAAVCRRFSADLAKQWRKIVGGFLRSEKSIFPFPFIFSASFSCFFFLFHWRARDKKTVLSLVFNLKSLLLNFNSVLLIFNSLQVKIHSLLLHFDSLLLIINSLQVKMHSLLLIFYSLHVKMHCLLLNFNSLLLTKTSTILMRRCYNFQKSGSSSAES